MQNIVNKMKRDFKQINARYLPRSNFEGPLYNLGHHLQPLGFPEGLAQVGF